MAPAIARGGTPKLAGTEPRLKTAICAYSFRKALGDGSLSYLDLVDMAVESKVDGIDSTVYWFPRDDLDSFLVSFRRKAYLAAVELPSIAIRSDLCRPTAYEQEREAAWLRHWVDVSYRLGSSHIRVFGGKVPEGSSEDQAATWVAEILKRAADHAADRGVVLGLENHGGITSRAERIIQIVRAVDHPNVGINLDTGNFHSEPYEQIEMCLPYAVNSQFKVQIRNEAGEHVPSDWDRIVRMFAKAGYRGYLALEYEAQEDPFTAVPRHLARLRELAERHGAA
jgi:sugar phosphate isomerase/epimerase